MCGIAGFADFKCSSNRDFLIDMTDALYRRGPDSCGYNFYLEKFAQVGLGHRRLSVLDLSKNGSQPMIFEDIGIVFNGEIYNFKETRRALENRGYVFNSNSDTEVVLKAYHCWGVEAVHRFIGMFAIAIYDKPKQKIFLIRDRAGVKPLYYYFGQDLFLFASELKSFHRHPGFKKKLNQDALGLFFQYGYIPQPNCIFKDAYKLKSGSVLELDLATKQKREIVYWDVNTSYSLPKLRISESDILLETERILESAFNYRMVSDVPVGVFLSGGYDSSLVTAILQKDRTERIKTFTIGFREHKYNEAHYAARVAEYLGTDHTEYYCTAKDAAEILPLLPELWDEPFGDSSAIPTMLVSKLAREKVTVSLSADGADEIFGGYSKYTGIMKKRRLFSLPPKMSMGILKKSLQANFFHSLAENIGFKNAEERMNRFSLSLECDEVRLLSIGSSTFTKPELNRLFKSPCKDLPSFFDMPSSSDWMNNLLLVDYKTYMVDDILTKVDRATMSVSLEGREPFLDHRIVEFLARLPMNYKIRNGSKKYLLKKITHKFLPKQLMDRPKMGFGVPIFEWLRGDLRDYLLQYLSESRLEKRGLYNVPYIVEIRDSYLDGKTANIFKLWYLLVFEMWCDQWAL